MDASIAASGSITDNGALVFDPAASESYANVISGNGTLTKMGTGNVTLGNAANTYSGGTAINVGGIVFAGLGAVGGSGANVTLASSGFAAEASAVNQAFLARIAPASTGAVALAAYSASALDFSSATGAGLSAASLGAVGSQTYAGTLTPYNNTYRLGGGNTLTLNTGLSYSAAGNALAKNENGTLVLTAAATLGVTPTSGTTINAGALKITNSNQIGSGTITVANNVGAALQISGGATFTQAMRLSNYGINGAGALESSGSNTWNTGVITMANAGAIGVDSGTLTIGSSITATNAVGFVGAGNVNINGGFTGTNSVTQYGTGLITLNATGTTYGNLSADAGTVKLAGTATVGAGGQYADYGGAITVDDTVTNTANRMLAHSFNTVGGGSFNLIGSAGATSTEGFLSNVVGRGQTTYTVTPGAGQQANLTLTNTGGA